MKKTEKSEQKVFRLEATIENRQNNIQSFDSLNGNMYQEDTEQQLHKATTEKKKSKGKVDE